MKKLITFPLKFNSNNLLLVVIYGSVLPKDNHPPLEMAAILANPTAKRKKSEGNFI
ncbi:MAG: hypothetical protein ACI9FJ_001702 [Alteromonadaceae bacterium]|jgi:hypothetical protein